MLASTIDNCHSSCMLTHCNAGDKIALCAGTVRPRGKIQRRKLLAESAARRMGVAAPSPTPTGRTSPSNYCWSKAQNSYSQIWSPWAKLRTNEVLASPKAHPRARNPQPNVEVFSWTQSLSFSWSEVHVCSFCCSTVINHLF